MEDVQGLFNELKARSLDYCKEKGYNKAILYLKAYDKDDIHQEIYHEKSSQHTYILDQSEVENDRLMNFKLRECFQPLSEYLGDMILQVDTSNQDISVFSEIECASLDVISGQGVRDYLYTQFLPFLKKGVGYTYKIDIGSGTANLSRYAWPVMVRSGEKVENEEEYNIFSDADLFIHDALIRLIAKTMPVNCMIAFTFSDEESLSVKVLDDMERINDFKMLHMVQLKELKLDKMICTIDFTKYLENPSPNFCDIEAQAYLTKGDHFKSDMYLYDTEALKLCKDLNLNIKKMQVIVTSESVELNADCPNDTLTIGAIKEEKPETANPQLIFTYLESGDAEKIEQGLSQLDGSPDIKLLAEKRYLMFIRAATDNEDATLADMIKLKDDLDIKKISSFFESGYSACFKDNRFLLGLSRSIDIKMLVNFIGSTVKGYFNIDDIIDEINTIYEKEGCVDTNKIITTYQKRYKKRLSDLVKESPVTWYTKALDKLRKASICEVYFDSVSFDKASKSPVIREFIFFLHMISTGELEFNAYDSSEITLTDAIWLYKQEPEIKMENSFYYIDECPLKIKRVLSFLEDDDRGGLEPKIYRAND